MTRSSRPPRRWAAVAAIALAGALALPAAAAAAAPPGHRTEADPAAPQ